MAEPRFIRFVEVADSATRKPQYWIESKRQGSLLGRIVWYSAWRQYCAEFSETAIWSHDCLTDVASFLVKLNKETK